MYSLSVSPGRIFATGACPAAVSLTLFSALSESFVKRGTHSLLPNTQLPSVCGLSSRIGSFSEPFRRFRAYNIESFESRQMAGLQRRYLSGTVSTSMVATTKDTEFFNRKMEIEAIHAVLESKPQISLISGPKNSGKTALITKVLHEKSQDNSPVLYINLREVAFRSSEEFISALEKFMDSWVSNLIARCRSLIPKSEFEASFLSTFKFTLHGNNPEDKDITSPARLEKLLTQMNGLLPSFSILKGKLSPVLFIDEANRMNELFGDDNGRSCLRNLFNWFVSNTKESRRFHVMLASSDSFFHRWLQENYLSGGVFSTYTIGDLPKKEAERYWNEELKPDSNTSLFEEAYRVCGGNIYYLQNYASEAMLKYGYGGTSQLLLPTQKKRMDPGAFSYVRQESGRLDNLFRLSHPSDGPWTKEQFITLINKLVSKADSGADCFLIYNDLCAEMGDSRVVDAFIEKNILHVRTSKDFAYDLMDAPEDATIVTPENASILFAMKKILIKQAALTSNRDSIQLQTSDDIKLNESGVVI